MLNSTTTYKDREIRIFLMRLLQPNGRLPVYAWTVTINEEPHFGSHEDLFQSPDSANSNALEFAKRLIDQT